jgi:signal transduction histidine kinase
VEPEHLPHIFNRFYRILEKSIVDGSGIGLNLTKELVDLWGGTIHTESPIHEEPDCPGIRFTVRLPIDLEYISNRGAAHEEKE